MHIVSPLNQHAQCLDQALPSLALIQEPKVAEHDVIRSVPPPFPHDCPLVSCRRGNADVTAYGYHLNPLPKRISTQYTMVFCVGNNGHVAPAS